ncbi:hypothetical protein NDU88_003260 [Pleurodeles waltl]|uniref:Radial spoke head protein 9 homolog n=1 Tax=Pleurodeles waltl TaxID=8319 RepID=A0AAV7UDJ8_PLEWA|nr:hypothetical protein NDU88_003260 [Pleurodeles waltl]
MQERLLWSLGPSHREAKALSLEQRATLRSSLLLIQRDYCYRQVLLWGRILGLRGDFFIARGEEEPGPEEEPEQLRGVKTLGCICLIPPPPHTRQQLRCA